nr:gag pol polyprotein [Hymenolepis microstoma]
MKPPEDDFVMQMLLIVSGMHTLTQTRTRSNYHSISYSGCSSRNKEVEATQPLHHAADGILKVSTDSLMLVGSSSTHLNQTLIRGKETVGGMNTATFLADWYYSSNLRNKKISKTDLFCAYNQIPIPEADIPKTAIAIPLGLFESH